VSCHGEGEPNADSWIALPPRAGSKKKTRRRPMQGKREELQIQDRSLGVHPRGRAGLGGGDEATRTFSYRARLSYCIAVFIGGLLLFACSGDHDGPLSPVAVSPRTQASTTYYLSPSGNNSNPGTSPASAWQTLDKINSTQFSSGATILLQGGTQFAGGIYVSSEDVGPLTISSYGSGRATIRAGTGNGIHAYNLGGVLVSNINLVGDGSTVNTGDGFVLNTDLPGNVKLNYLHISDVDVSGFGKSGIFIYGGNGRSGYRDIKITRVRAHHNQNTGISVTGIFSASSPGYAHANVYIGYSWAYNNPGTPGLSYNSGSGIVISNVDGGTIEHSIAYSNGAQNTAVGGPVGIWAWEANNVLIQHNESYGNHTNSTADGGGFDLDGGVTNSIMQYNYSHGNDGPGFLLAQFSGARPFYGNTVRYNISQNDGRKNSDSGIALWRAGSTQLRDVKIYNNVVYIKPAPTGASRAVEVASPTVNVHFRNNVLITTGGLALVEAVAGQSGILFQSNSYWPSGGVFKIRWSGANYSGLNAWRTGTGQEVLNGSSTGFTADPKLTSPGTGATINDTSLLPTLTAYKLRSDSPLIDAGLNLLSLFAIDPGPRDFYARSIPKGAGYDVGAHERR